MKKLFEFCKANILFLATLGLLAFIPLYPKLPVLDIRHTWVYVRIEDFIVLFVLLLWGILVVSKKINLKTPLTTPILLFWTIGAIATIHGVLLIFSTLSDTHGNVALLSFVRRIEYMSLFFIAYSAMREKRFISWVSIVLLLTVFGVTLYGIGQKYVGFPAFLTMNEEFAKGIPIRLSELSRVSSTFSGHYDLAAYLVLVVPILISLAFGAKHWAWRGALLAASILGFIVMVMTVSRISLFALVCMVGLVVFIHKKKLIVILIPILIIGIFIVVSFSPGIINRFGSTVKEIDVLVSATTGEAVGHTKIVPREYFAQKTVKQVFSTDIANLYDHASPSATLIVPLAHVENDPVLFIEPNAPNGENLPQGSGYINLSLSPVLRKTGRFYYEPIPKVATTSGEVFVINGSYLLKKVFAYDISFTTRFQGEWPRAMDTFRKNILIGSGYGSVGLAVDNSYLRMLAEVGILGTLAFLGIFMIAGIHIRTMWSTLQNENARYFIIGFVAGVGGLAMNAFFIDVFEASKVAFVLWLLFGVTMGMLTLYSKRTLSDDFSALKSLLLSPVAVMSYLLILTIVLYSSITSNNFVGDDFTWLRWAADCGKNTVLTPGCNVNASVIRDYFTQSQGFFYRPGAKIYFLIMYWIFWLNQNAYHTVSLMLHFGVTLLVFLLAKKILKNLLLSAMVAAIFLLQSGHMEPVFWISATGFLFTSFFSLLSVLAYISWHEQGKRRYAMVAVASFVLSLLTHELGIVTPLLYLLYIVSQHGWEGLVGKIRTASHAMLFAPVPLYILVRYLAASHWFNGDYSYNILKLPLNSIGNAVGYMALGIVGPMVLPFTDALRAAGRTHMMIASVSLVVMMCMFLWIWKKYRRHLDPGDSREIFFGLGFFFIALLPFLGLGNMTSRYSYLSSVGIAFLIVIMAKKLYNFLFLSGRTIAVLSIVTLSGTFVLLQTIQHQQLQTDWHDAGEISREFIVAMDRSYEDHWRSELMEFHFVNIPIRTGEAWVFPVGLPDALWLVFRNPTMRVFSWPSLELASDAVGYNQRNKKIFEFDERGTVVERNIRSTAP